jgi:hypothetical protein
LCYSFVLHWYYTTGSDRLASGLSVACIEDESLHIARLSVCHEQVI